jgi:hypothetical protein
MAVTVRRSDVTLWVAWVLAAGIGTVGSELMAPVHNFFEVDVAFALRTLPAVLLQYLVLRAIAGLPPAAGALWVGGSLLAVLLWLSVSELWLEGVIGLGALLRSHSLTDALLRLDPPIYALLLGLSQGIALATLSGRKVVAVIWVAASVVAFAEPVLSGLANVLLLNAGQSLTPALSAVVDQVAYAAATGVALIALLRFWGPPREPAPAVR